MAEDLYALLGVPRDATPQDIKKAFRTLAKELHPDVVGEDEAKVERFKRIKDAYEVLGDPQERARYDRRHERRSGGPSTVNVHWANPSRGGGSRSAGAQNDLDLEDLVNGFGNPDFGFGGGRPRSARSTTPPPPPRTQPGRDIPLTVNVPAAIAEAGGTVTVTYTRLRRADDGRTLYRYEELHDLRIAAGTRHGETIRIEKMGDAGAEGGPFGDLVCDLRVVGEARPRPGPPPGPAPGSTPGPDPGGHVGETVRVAIGVVEAILGGRVEVPTPGGPVRITIPPGTSSGTRLRLRGRGNAGSDLYAEVRIVVPRSIDEESRRLIERFGELNPTAGD